MIEYINDFKLINDFLQNFDSKIEEISVFQKFIIFKENNEFIGFADFSLIYDRIEINYIFVNKESRRKNIASKLINFIEKVGKNNKCINISLEVNENNVNAIKFYEKNGFKKNAIRENYYPDGNGILMMKEMIV